MQNMKRFTDALKDTHTLNYTLKPRLIELSDGYRFKVGALLNSQGERNRDITIKARSKTKSQNNPKKQSTHI